MSAELAELLTAIDTEASGFTLCEVARGRGISGASSNNVTAYLVISGTLHLHWRGGGLKARAGEMALIPARVVPVIAAQASMPGQIVPGAQSLSRRDGLPVADATRGGKAVLRVAATRIVGTNAATLPAYALIDIGGDARGSKALEQLQQEIAAPLTGGNALAVTLMRACVVIALRLLSGSRDDALSSADRQRRRAIQRAIAVVMARPADAHCVATLAHLAGMSRSTFVRHFTRMMQAGPMEFVQRARLNEAASMLRMTELPVKTIAADVGFASRSHFSRAFRALHGQDPSDFRLNGPAERAI